MYGEYTSFELINYISASAFYNSRYVIYTENTIFDTLAKFKAVNLR